MPPAELEGQELRRHVTLLDRVQSMAGLGSWDWDLTTNALTWSDENGRILGYEPGSVEPSFALFEAGLHPEDRERVLGVVQSATAMDGQFDLEFRVVRPDGQVRWIHGRGEVERAADGRPLRMLGMALDITERRAAKDALRRQAQFIQQTHDSVVTTDLEGNVTSWNRGAQTLLGRSEAEMLGKPIGLVYPPEEHDFLQRQVIEPLVARGEHHVVVRMRHRSGEDRHAHLTLGMLLGDHGEPVGMIGYAMDVTAQQQAEDALRAREEQLVDAQRIAKMGSWDLNLTTMALAWSDEIYRIFELDKTAFGATYEAFLDAVHPDDRALVDAAYTASVAERRTYEISHRLRMPDGRIKYVQERGRSFYDDAGRPLRSVGTVQDVTDRIAAETAVRKSREIIERSERRLAEAHHIAQLGAWELDLATGISWWSDEQYRLNGIELGTPIKQSFFLTMVHPEDRARFAGGFAMVLAEGSWSGEYRLVRPDGEVRHMYGIATATYDATGKPTRVSGTNQDITARHLAEQRIEAALREKETLLREIHHRVKNNLQVISSLLHFHAQKIRDPADRATLLDGRDRLRAMTLVHETLHVSSDLSRIDLGAYLRRLVGQVAQAHGSRNVAARVEAVECALPIELATPCGMLTCELVMNALKHGFPGDRRGEVLVCIARADDRLELTVRDDGVGFPSEFGPEAPASFGWQLIGGLTTQLGGTLSIARGHGAAVTVSFPVQGGKP